MLHGDAAIRAAGALLPSLNQSGGSAADVQRAVSFLEEAGDPVRLHLAGPGFSITAGGQALGTAGAGQSVRVRTDLGKILTGVAREGRRVDVTL